MKSVLVCGLLALALGATVKDKLSVKAGDISCDSSTVLYRLLPGFQLTCGQSLISPYGGVKLTMQSNGNLVLSAGLAVIWSSGTSNHFGAYALMQTDSNFVVYQGTTVLWSSGSTSPPHAFLQLDENANLEVTYGIRMSWSWKYGLLANLEAPQKLPSGGNLLPGMSLLSPSSTVFLAMQRDGNLVLYKSSINLWTNNTVALWSSGTSNHTGAYALMQTDGNFVVYLGTSVLWSSGTGGQIGAYLQVQDDTNLAVYSSGNLMLCSWKYGLLANPSEPKKLPSGGKLLSGMYLLSPNGQIRLTMQSDGNLFLYKNGTKLWSSLPSGKSGAFAWMQTDGNLVVYLGTTVLWSSGTGGQNGAYLQVQDDINLAVYSSVNLMLWSWKYGLLTNSSELNKLSSGGKLLPGMYLISPNGQVSLAMQSDGNLVLYQNMTTLWSSGTSNHIGAYALMQTNGNFVVDLGTTVLWSSGTAGWAGAYLQVQDDTNLAVYSSGNLMLWWWKYGAVGNPTAPNKFPSGGKLLSGMYLISPNGQIRLTMQSDGNLVLYQNLTTLWSSASSGKSGAFACMQTDGNFVVDLGTTVLWSSGTAGWTGAYLQVQDDTNLAVYSSGNLMLWSWKYGLFANPAAPMKLPSGGKLLRGTCLLSPNGQIRLEGYGKLVLYQNMTTLWIINTSVDDQAYAVMQTDGDLVVYQGNIGISASKTAGHPGAYLQVQDDTNLAVYSSGNLVLWSWKCGLLANPAAPMKLPSGGKLLFGMGLLSPNGQVSLAMKSDGNLIFYQNKTALWSCGIVNHTEAYALMQTDGNFVVYQGTTVLWSSGSAGQTGAYLQVQDDTNLAIYSSGNLMLWSWKCGLLANPAARMKLPSGGKMLPDMGLLSPNRQVFLAMQSDGNLVLYQNMIALWSSGTRMAVEAYALMKTDGNLVIYLGTTVIWSSGTGGHTGAYLQVQDDTNLAVYSSGNLMLWSWKYGLLANPSEPNILHSGGKLLDGMCLQSPNRQVFLAMQSDGNLVLYQNMTALWSSASSGKSGAFAWMQTDGNLVVYLGTTVLWLSGTGGQTGAYLQVQDDTNLAVYSSGNLMLWSWKYGLLANPSEPNKLSSGGKLLDGKCLLSPNRQVFLAMQRDGNLVLYKNMTALWSIAFPGKSGAFAWMQIDGNFVIYLGTTPLWSSSTAGQPGAYLEVRDDTNVVIYNSEGKVVWSKQQALV